jgi:hypothetical protein
VGALLCVFLFGEMMTTKPGGISGNGNPAILLLVPISILLITLVICWSYAFKNKNISSIFIKVSMAIVVLHMVLGAVYQVQSFKKYKDYLAEIYNEKHGYVDWPYIHSITDGLTIHVNNQYFNVNTFMMCVSFSFFLFLVIVSLFKTRTGNQAERGII